MSDDREPRWYGPLRETQERVAEEEAQRRAAEAAPDNSPEARLAAMERELSEKLRAGRINKSEMAYQLRRFENAMLVEMNNEDAQRARDEAAARTQPGRPSQEADRNSQTAVERQDQAAGHVAGPEISDARATRMARLREITERLAQQGHDADGSGRARDQGDRSR
jgi:dTMP kinase